MADASTTPADEELLARFARGDASAFELLYGRYRRPIYTYILRSARDQGHAEELLQEVFLRVVQRAEEFKGDSKFSTWLYSITRNLCIDHSRKMAFRRHQSLDATRDGEDGVGSSLGDRTAAEDIPADRLVDSTALAVRMEAAIGALPDDQREVFLMRQVQQLPFQEIAEITGVPENTVKSRMRYALERLQKVLADDEPNVTEVG